MRRHWSLAMLLLAGSLAACGGSYSTGPGGSNGGTGGTTGGGGGYNPPGEGGGNSGPNTVTVANNSFSPSRITVAKGTTVTWQWSAGAVTHNVTFDDGAKSASMSSGSYTRTFTTAGSFPYHCTIHGPAMSGTVTVQ
ncbi:MAG TPA: plastocyanin/azurin family copper-binding protein [Gemmatimonadaceae bacterium]|nr:plastocyanin/azurin family copper-binding protein [Gemmatimonadaceae bacterium]